MGRTQNELLRFPRLSIASQPGLPLGIRQADCDGPLYELVNADGGALWNACDASGQESLSDRFIHNSAESLRDALLDAQDRAAAGTGPSNQAAGDSLGRLVWLMWISYRDRALREMARRGEI